MSAYRVEERSDDWRSGSALVRVSDNYEVLDDRSEPEDATLRRDYAPLVAELNRVAARVAALEAALQEVAERAASTVRVEGLQVATPIKVEDSIRVALAYVAEPARALLGAKERT